MMVFICAVGTFYSGGWGGLFDDYIVPIMPITPMDVIAPVMFLDSPIDVSYPDKLNIPSLPMA